MQTAYRIDTFQQTYFVLDRFDQLFESTRGDLRERLLRISAQAPIAATQVQADDQVISRGQWPVVVSSLDSGPMVTDLQGAPR